jgi:hypothetical protein
MLANNSHDPEIYMNMFDRSGQLNASSLKDLTQQLVRYASILEDNMPSNTGLAGQPSLSDSTRDDLIARAIQTQDGKIALAQAMANPIK